MNQAMMLLRRYPDLQDAKTVDNMLQLKKYLTFSVRDFAIFDAGKVGYKIMKGGQDFR
jgi:hypothetical protein